MVDLLYIRPFNENLQNDVGNPSLVDFLELCKEQSIVHNTFDNQDVSDIVYGKMPSSPSTCYLDIDPHIIPTEGGGSFIQSSKPCRACKIVLADLNKQVI